MTHHIFYHRIDADGWLSGALLRTLTVRDGETAITVMRGADYHDTFDFSDIKKEDSVLIGDFTFSTEDWKKLLKTIPADNILWYDHHIKNYEKVYEEVPETKDLKGLRDNSHAACRLIFEHNNLQDVYGEGAAKVVNQVSAWDTWQHNEDPDILNFTAGLLLYNTDPATNEGYDFWDKCVFNYREDFCNKITEDGTKVKAVYQSQYENERKAGTTINVNLKDTLYKLFIVNSSFSNSYMFGAEILNSHDACLAWRYTLESDDVKCSARSVTGKANAVAAFCGGGGHADASGFHLPLAKFVEIFFEGTEEYKSELSNYCKKK